MSRIRMGLMGCLSSESTGEVYYYWKHCGNTLAIVTASMVNDWQQLNSGRTNPGVLGKYSNELAAKPSSAHGLTSSQAQPISSTTTARGVSSSQTFPFSSSGVSASVRSAISGQTGNPSSISRQGSTPGSARTQARPISKQSYSTSESLTFPSFRTASTAVERLAGANEGGEDVSDEDEVESDEDEDNDDEDDDDDDNAITGKKEISGPSKGKQRTSSSKAKRFRLTHNQTRFLMGEFARQTHPDGAQRRRLSKEIPGLSPRQVQVWFQNRRAKLKRLTVEDREKMMKSRALPEDFDISNTLRSPFTIDASKDFSAQRQTSMLSPTRSSTMQSNDGLRNRSSIDASGWRRVSGEGYTESPLSLATEFSPYLVQIGQGDIPISSTILAASPEIGPFPYEQHHQAHPQLAEATVQSAGFSSAIPGSSTQLQIGSEQHPEAQLMPDVSKPLRYRQSPGTPLELSNQSQGNTAASGNIAESYKMHGQDAATFPNLPQEALAFWNAQAPLQSSPGQYYDFQQSLALQASPVPLPQSFSGRTPLQINTTQPEHSNSNVLLNQQSSPGYTRTIHDTRQGRQGRPRQVQSPATAYQTPISATLQGLPLQNSQDDYLLHYQLDTGKEIVDYNIGSMQSPGAAESYQELQRQFKAESDLSGQVPGMPIPGTVYESPYQLSHQQVPNIIPVTNSRYESLTRTAGFGEMPPTPQSAGLKRRYYDESEANPYQVSTSQKRRKKTTVSSAYKSQDLGQEPPT